MSEYKGGDVCSLEKKLDTEDRPVPVPKRGFALAPVKMAIGSWTAEAAVAVVETGAGAMDEDAETEGTGPFVVLGGMAAVDTGAVDGADAAVELACDAAAAFASSSCFNSLARAAVWDSGCGLPGVEGVLEEPGELEGKLDSMAAMFPIGTEPD